jgi:iron complex transport system substrate-binding protein
MKKKISFSLFSLLILAFPTWSSQDRSIKDDLDQIFFLGSPPQRIVSLAPNITETLFSLGLGERIVGVTRYCDFPKNAQQKEKIGGMIDPNLEKILSLNPDLVIGFRGNPLRTLERIKSLGLPLFVLSMGTTLTSVYALIEKIGIITQKEDAAHELMLRLKTKHSYIQDSLRNVEFTPKVFFILHGPGLWTGGKDSLFDVLIKEAKGINIAGSINRKWLLFNREQLLYENPDILIIISRSKDAFLKTKNWIKGEALANSLKAIEGDKVFFLDENLVTRPGPRLIDALENLAHILHPEQFKQQ